MQGGGRKEEKGERSLNFLRNFVGFTVSETLAGSESFTII